MQPLEHKAPSLSILNKEDENVPKVRGQAWSKTPTPLQPSTSISSHNRNASPRKPKKLEKERRAKVTVKRRFKVRVITQPMSVNPTLPMNPIPPAKFTSPVATLTATTPEVKSAATSISVTVYNLVQGRFEGIPYPTGKPQQKENPSTHSCNTPQEREQPVAVAPHNREDTPWPNTMPASTNLIDVRASCPIPPTETPTVVKMEKTEIPPRVAAIPHGLVLNN